MSTTLTLGGQGFFEWVVRRSRFIGVARPVASEEEAVSLLRAVREEWPRGNHYPYAYRLGTPVQRQKCSDDGEPAGTAGRPILGALERRKVSGACVVVIRYFGGVLLGAGPLARAYGRAAEGAIDAAGVVPAVVMRRWALCVPYAHLDELARGVERLGGKWQAAMYAARVEGVLSLPEGSDEQAVERLLALADEVRRL